MKLISRASAGFVIALAAGVAIGLTTVGSAAAAPAASTGKTATYHYSLSASAFAPDGLHDTTQDYFNQWDPAALSNTDAGRCFNASLSLPSKAALKSVTFYYTAGSAVMYTELSRQDLANHTDVDLASSDTTIDSTPTYTSSTKPIAAADAMVNMRYYAYTVGVCPNGTSTFSGVTVTYTLPVS